jgi:hypothetical protein
MLSPRAHRPHRALPNPSLLIPRIGPIVGTALAIRIVQAIRMMRATRIARMPMILIALAGAGITGTTATTW